MKRQKLEGIESLNQFFFPVRKAKLSEEFPGYVANSSISHLIIVTPPNQPPRIVNACSDEYRLVDNQKLFTPLLDAIGSNFSHVLIKDAKHFGYSKFFFDLIFMESGMEVLEKDKIYPKATIWNSYDGSMKLTFNGGLYRLACTNGLMVPEGAKSDPYIAMHTIGTNDDPNEFAGELVEYMKDFIQDMKSIILPYQELAKEKFKSLDSAKKRMNDAVKYTEFPKRTQPIAEQRLNHEHKDLKLELTDYLVYNALNWALNNNEESKLKPNKIQAIDKEVLQFLIKY